MAGASNAALIDAMYETAMKPAEWPAMITMLADHLGATGGMLVRNAENPEASSIVIGRLCPEVSERYIRYYTDNPWTQAAKSVPIGEVGILGQLFDLREGRHLAWYSDILVPTRTQDVVLLTLPGFTSALSVGGMGFCFSEPGGPTTEKAAHHLKALQSHLRRAIWLSLQVDKARILDQRLDAMLNASPRPIFLVSAGHRVVGANPAGEILLQQQSGLSVDSAGQLRASSAVDTNALRAAIARAADRRHQQGRGPMAVQISRPPKAPLRLLFMPLPQSVPFTALDPGLRASVLITVMDAQASFDDQIGSAMAVYGLTPMEARVAVLLTSGVGRKTAAQSLRISVETIKKHAEACFRKIGVNSQAGLAQMIAGLPVQRQWTEQLVVDKKDSNG